MIKINQKEETKFLGLQELIVGHWYILEDGDIANYDGYSEDKDAYTFICFGEGRLFPNIYYFLSSENRRFIPVEVESLEINLKTINK